MRLLVDLIPAKYRRYLYAIVSAASVVFAAYQASDDDWREFAAGVIAAAVSALATANTNAD